MKVITIGGSTIDVIVETKAGLDFCPGMKLDAKNISFCVGGGAVNSAIVLNKLGGSVTLCSAVGDDSEALLIIKKLTDLGIDTSCVSALPESVTGRAVITLTNNAEVSIVAQRGANLKFDGDTLPSRLNHQLLYISAISSSIVKRLSLMFSQGYANKTMVSFNPGFSQIKEGGRDLIFICKRVDLLILNQIEAIELLSTLGHRYLENVPIEDLGRVLIEQGIKAALITCGSKGAYFSSKDEVYFQPVIPVIAASTLGAGDTFGSTFSYYYFSGKSIEMSANLAAINASNTVSQIDANSGSLSHEKLFQQLSARNLDSV